MKRKVLSGLLVSLALTVGISSCTDSNNTEYEYTNSNECLITSLTMGSLKRTMHTKDSIGNDSIFYVSVTGALYPMTIDQNNLRIYNLDSLPVGTDTRHMVFTSINSIGGYTLRSLTSGNDTIFSLSDSTDFSVPRILTVHALNGTSKREYLVNINVHQQEGDSMIWNQVAASSSVISSLQHTRSLAVQQNLFVFGQKNDHAYVASANLENYKNSGILQWDETSISSAIQPESVVRFQNRFYAIGNDQKIFTSDNGMDWTSTNSNFTASTLVLAGSQQLVALKNGTFYSTTDGLSWTADECDETAYLPTESATGTVISSSIDKTFETLVVVGKNNGKNVVWKREIDLTGSTSYPWIYLPETPTSKFNLPQLNHINMNTYDGVTLLSGLTKEGSIAPLYLSKDNGRTWKTKGIKTPEAQGQNELTVTVDQDNFIWMFCGQTGEIWRGRINRLGWEDVPGAFE